MVSNFQQTTKLKRKKKRLGRNHLKWLPSCWKTAQLPFHHHGGVELWSRVSHFKRIFYRAISRDSNLEPKFDIQFQIKVQLQLPINSAPETKRTVVNIYLVKTGHYQPCFFFSVMAVSSIGQRNKSTHMNTRSRNGPSGSRLPLMHRMRTIQLQLFPASDEVLLKYHPPLIKTKGQGEEMNTGVTCNWEVTRILVLHCPFHPQLVVPKYSGV